MNDRWRIPFTRVIKAILMADSVSWLSLHLLLLTFYKLQRTIYQLPTFPLVKGVRKKKLRRNGMKFCSLILGFGDCATVQSLGLSKELNQQRGCTSCVCPAQTLTNQNRSDSIQLLILSCTQGHGTAIV